MAPSILFEFLSDEYGTGILMTLKLHFWSKVANGESKAKQSMRYEY